MITGGTVVDGTGERGRVADVAVLDGRVSDIGRDLKGEVVLDASGQVVAPGFIDIHTHYDAQVFWDPALTPSSFHGVTTVIAGNCGFSLAPTRPAHRERIVSILGSVEDMNPATLAQGIPWDFETFPEYLASVAQREPALNFASYIGHTPLRLYVMGEDAYDRPATGSELVSMCEILREAVEAGAVGLATSFLPLHRDFEGRAVPSSKAEVAEFEALARVVGELGHGVVEVSPGAQCPIEDLYEIQSRVGAPFTYGALRSKPTGDHHRLVQLHRRAWAAGARVWPQISPCKVTVEFTLAKPATLFNDNPAFTELAGATPAQRRAAYRDPTWRRRATESCRAQTVAPPRWEVFEIMASPAHPDLVGHSMSSVAATRGISPLEAMIDVALDDDLRTVVRAVVNNDDVREVASLLCEEHCTIGLSDAGAHLTQLCDAIQATDLLGTWVRSRRVMPLEQAVRKLTGAQADLFGLTGRGYLRPGDWADVVVFDPATVGTGPVRRVRDFPADAERLTAEDPTGVTHVLVNGTPIRVDGRQVLDQLDQRAGHVVGAGSAPAPDPNR